MASLANKVALVTGASRGIGRAVALALAREGAAVAVNYRERATDADEVVASIREAGGRAMAVAADVSDSAAVTNMIAAVERELGPVDVLVNNAGLAIMTGIDDLTEEQFDRTIAVNLKSAFLCTKAVLPGMRARKRGRIVNISSMNGAKGQFGQCNYAAAKAGMYGFTKSLALEVGRKGVTVNTVSPGYLGTKMVLSVPKEVMDTKILPLIPVGHLGPPEEIADLVAYLASEKAGYITGADLAINGGQYMY